MVRFLSSIFASCAIALAGTSLANAQSFTEINPIQPSETPDKIEVLEFFSYSCIHCFRVEPMTEKWANNLPEGTIFKRVPVGFNAGMHDLQKLYYTLESLDLLDNLHIAAFKAIHEQGKDIFTEQKITEWAAEQGIDKTEFTDTFNSFGVQTKVKRADELTKAYHIDSTPTFAIGGQFLTSPATAGGYQQSVDETNRLMQELLAKK